MLPSAASGSISWSSLPIPSNYLHQVGLLMWCFGSSAVASPDFSPPIVLTQVYLGFIRSKNLIPELGKPFVLPVAECSQWFVPCCKPSVLTFTRASLDYRL